MITAAVKVERPVQVRNMEVSTTIGDFPFLFEIFRTCTHAVSEYKVDICTVMCVFRQCIVEKMVERLGVIWFQFSAIH